MSATGWPAYRELLLQVTREQTGYRMMKRITWLLVIGAVIVVAVTNHFGKPTEGKAMLAMFLWGAAHMWCSGFLKSAIAQNRPEFASLVPHLRPRLMRLSAVLFIGSSLLLCLLAALLYGYPGYALLAGGLISIYVLFTARYPWLVFSPAVVVLFLAYTGTFEQLAPAVHRGLGQTGATILGTLLLLALGAWGLRLIFPQGGDAHWAWFKRYAANREFAARSATQLIPSTRFAEWWRAASGSGYRLALRQSSRKGDTPRRMMMYALGPDAHPSAHIAGTLALALLTLLLLAGARGRIEPQFYMLLGTILQWSVLMMSMMYVIRVVDGATRHRAEQAIMLLATGAPATAQVNRMLGGAMLRGFFQVWAVTLCCVMCIDFVLQGRIALRGPTFFLAILMLPLACILLRNYAVAQATSDQTWTTTVVLYAIVCNFLLSMANSRGDLPCFWLGSAAAAVSLLELHRRWRKLMALPPMLPAGRSG